MRTLTKKEWRVNYRNADYNVNGTTDWSENALIIKGYIFVFTDAGCEVDVEERVTVHHLSEYSTEDFFAEYFPEV